MNEFHIIDSSTNGDTVHARQYDNEVGWTVEICGDHPKLTRQLLATGAVRRPGYTSFVADASVEQVIQFLASASGYRCKVQKKVKRQYSPEHRAALAERLRNLHPTRNAIFTDISAQD